MKTQNIIIYLFSILSIIIGCIHIRDFGYNWKGILCLVMGLIINYNMFVILESKEAKA